MSIIKFMAIFLSLEVSLEMELMKLICKLSVTKCIPFATVVEA